jgi:TRAP-type C4-dicarboxylate transport system substrate-binding protein
MKKSIFLPVMLLLFGIFLSGQAQPALAQKKEAKPILWDAVTFLPRNNPMSEFFLGFVEKLNERAKGMLVVKYKGGPEVVPDRDQIDALRTGFVKIAFVPSGYGAELLPGATAAEFFTISPADRRKNGLHDLMVEMVKKIGILHLGVIDYPNDRPLVTTVPVRRLDDLKGLKIRGTTQDLDFIRALGAEPISLPFSELVTALERGVCQGYFVPTISYKASKAYEIARYVLDERISYGGGLVAWVNLKAFDGLSGPLQKLLKDTMVDSEPEIGIKMEKFRTDALEQLKAAGVQYIKLPPEEGRKYKNLRYETAWATAKKLAPDWAPKFQKLAGGFD